MAGHPELDAEQAYIDHAYECLDNTRRVASKLTSMVEVGRGGTEQARYERDVIWDTMLNRLSQLDLGDSALCFGRIDTERADDVEPDTFYIGRIALSDESQEPVIVDWRAPVAEPFYRATGRQPLGLARRRHFATRGRQLLGIEDELFGDAAAALGLDGATGSGDDRITGHGALIAALETNRSGKLGDIVSTIQGEQDEIIRAPMPGVLVVQGGPGTGKTVVALHRAAYLLYTHRFPLEGQGVLVVGPNKLFLGYIDQVLPSLGEAGVQLAVLADLIDDVRVAGYDTGLTSRVKGDLRMVEVISRAVRDRERALRADLVVGYGLQHLRLSVDETRRIVGEARRRYRRHNAGRKWVVGEVFAALARSGRGELDPADVRDRLKTDLAVREALEWMWPLLTPGQLLHDLFGSKALLASAGRAHLEEHECLALHRAREASVDQVVFTTSDVPLLDEAFARLGPKPRRRRVGEEVQDDEVRTYGHIVVDEAQDLSPMELRVLRRRSLNGSMTIVGDIAQATGSWAHDSWDEILEHLPAMVSSRKVELTIGYRLPAPNMALAARVLAVAAPGLEPPRSIRQDGSEPRIVATATREDLLGAICAVTRGETEAVGVGSVAVICPTSLVDEVSDALETAGIDHGRANRHGLDQQVTVVPVRLVKGLEVDSGIVVEPAAIVDEEPQGLRSLYVALTRGTKRLALVHHLDPPEPLMQGDA